MSASALRQTLLTRPRLSSSALTSVPSHHLLYRPLFSPRHFANMTDTGVHNLKG